MRCVRQILARVRTMSDRQCAYQIYCDRPSGFTLVELIVVIALLAILTGIAVPSFVQWNDNLKYREAGRNLSAFIRSARSEAIARNRQYRVNINVAARTYQLQRGDSALGSTIWTNTTQGAVTATRISLAGNNTIIVCNPNGTMEFNPFGGATTRITIFDNQTNAVADVNSQRYRIDLRNTGRITVNKVGAADGAP